MDVSVAWDDMYDGRTRWLYGCGIERDGRMRCDDGRLDYGAQFEFLLANVRMEAIPL